MPAVPRGKSRKASRLAVREEFISWLLIPEKERVKLGLPRTVVAFAEAKGVGERTLRRAKAFALGCKEHRARRCCALVDDENMLGQDLPPQFCFWAELSKMSGPRNLIERWRLPSPNPSRLRAGGET